MMLVAVAETGSMHKAAKKLGTSAQAIAKAISRYEDQVGATLLVRAHGGAFPTLVGNFAVERARRILSEMEEADRLFNQLRDALNDLGPSKW